MSARISFSSILVRLFRNQSAASLGVAKRSLSATTGTSRALGAFVLVDPDGYRTEAALAKWVKRGVDSVSTLPAKSNGRPMGRRRSRDAVPAEQRNSVRSRHLDAAVAAVKKCGIAVLMENETPACRMAMINDTEGNIVTLHKRKVA